VGGGVVMGGGVAVKSGVAVGGGVAVGIIVAVGMGVAVTVGVGDGVGVPSTAATTVTCPFTPVDSIRIPFVLTISVGFFISGSVITSVKVAVSPGPPVTITFNRAIT